MTAKELIQFQLDDAGYQLNKVLTGFPDGAMDAKGHSGAFSPRETIAHLCEAYCALADDLAGKQHEWGSYQPADTATEAMLAEMRSLRSAAIAGLPDTEDGCRKAHMYVIGHDYYHVGQLCSLRVAADPEWDAYAIYPQG